MHENSINTLTILSQTHMNDEAESGIIDFEERKNNIEIQKKDLEHLIAQFDLRRGQLFHHIEEFSKTKNNFIKKSNQFFRDHQKKIVNLKDEIRLLKDKLENERKNKEKILEKIHIILLSIETGNFNIRKLERQEQEIDERMKLFIRTIQNGDDNDFRNRIKETKKKQIQKSIKDTEKSIERYESLILNYELQMSELKLKNKECNEKQTNITEQANTILIKDNFQFLAIKEKINQMKTIPSPKYNHDINKTQSTEINKNKTNIQHQIFDVTNQLKSTNDRLNEIKEEIQFKIQEIQNIQQLIEKPNNAIQKLRTRRIKRENSIKSKSNQFNQAKTKIESKKKLYQEKNSELKKTELKLNSEIKELDENILNEDVKEKEISLQSDILIKENEKNRQIEIIQTKKSFEILDQIQRKIELQRNQNIHNSTKNSSRTMHLNSTSNSNILINCSSKLKQKPNENKRNPKNKANSSNSLNDKIKFQLTEKSVFTQTSKNSEIKKGNSLQSKNLEINKNLEKQISQTKEAINKFRLKYSKEKQHYLSLQIQYKILQSNNTDLAENKCFKDIKKKIADGRLCFLQRLVEMSNFNNEIEIQIQKKLEKIELTKNRLHNLKVEEDSKNNLMIAYSHLENKSSAFPIDSVYRHETASWLYLMINKEKEEWIKYHNNITINSLLNVWNSFLDRM